MADNPNKQSADELTNKAVEQRAEQPADEPAKKIAKQATEESAGTVAQQLAETAAEASANQSTKQVLEQPVEEPVELPAQLPAQQPVEPPAELPAEQPPEVPSNEPAHHSAQPPTEQLATQPPELPAKKSSPLPPERPTNKPTQQPANQSNEQAEQVDNKPAEPDEQAGPSRSESNRFRYFEDNFFARNAPSMTPALKFRSPVEVRECFNYIPRISLKKRDINFDINLTNREQGLSDSVRHRLRAGLSTGFESRYYSSFYTLRKMKRVARLEAGRGPFEEKALHFNRVGNLLLFNSPRDNCVVVQIWDWQKKRRLYEYIPGGDEAHLRITDAKFLNINTAVVTVCEAGSQNLGLIPPSGGEIEPIKMFRCNMASGRLGLCPLNPFVYYSASTNGDIGRCDVRAPPGKVIKTVMENKFYGLLFSVSHHPVKPEICVGCSDNKVRIFDLRNLQGIVAELCPQRIISEGFISLSCTAEYSCSGNEILASYSYEDHYLLNNVVYDQPNSYLQRYTGHYPTQSVSNVGFASNAKFWGPNGEYVMASSELCGIYTWETYTGKFAGMLGKVVDQEYIDTHQSLPFLATFSRAPHNRVRVWNPRMSSLPDLSYNKYRR